MQEDAPPSRSTSTPRIRHARALGTPAFVVAGVGPAIEDRAGLRGGGTARAEIAAQLGCDPGTVGKWRHRFAADRLDGLVDAPRPGAGPAPIGDDVIEAVVVETLESSTARRHALVDKRNLAAKHGISHHHGKRDLAGVRAQTVASPDGFKVSPDPDLVEKIRDLVGALHEPAGRRRRVRPSTRKPQIQALNRTTPTLPMLPTTPGPGHPRLRAQRHLQPLRRPRRGHRDGDHRHPPSPTRAPTSSPF